MLSLFTIHSWAPEYPGTQKKPKSSLRTHCRSEYLWGLIYWFAEPDYHILEIRFLVCHIINPWFNLEAPWSMSIYQWWPKEKQFCNCQTHDEMVKRTWNQLCKLWYVSHTSICTVTVWKLELSFLNIEKKSKTMCSILWRKLMYYVQIICNMPHSTLNFFSHSTCGSRTISVVFNLIF